MEKFTLKLTLLACLLLTALSGCKKEESTSALKGCVTDAETNSPIASVSVEITGTTGAVYKKTTDESGNFVFENIALDTYSISFAKADYSGETESVTVGKGKETTYNKTLTFTKSLGLRGKVTNSRTKAAVSGVTVKIKSTNKSTSTNSSGEYSLSEVKRGEYTLSFEKTDYKTAEKTVTVTADDANNTLDAEIESTITTLTGRVTDSEGYPVNGVVVRIKGATTQTVTGVNGDYALNGMKIGESYTIVFDKAIYELLEKYVTIADDNATLDAQLVPVATRLVGRVTNANTGGAINGAVVRLSPTATPSAYTTSSTGTYTFTDLYQSSYTITVSATGYYDYSSTLTVINRDYENTFDVQMSPSTSSAAVSVSSVLTIENEAAIIVSFSGNPARFYRAYYPKSLLPSDATITSNLLSSSPINTSYDVTLYKGLNANTTYVFCAIAVDGSNAPGRLLKYEFTTKSSAAAKALITIRNITSVGFGFDIRRNAYCYSYVRGLYSGLDYDTWDIELALMGYLATNSSTLMTVDRIDYVLSGLTPNTTYVYFTLGYSTTTGAISSSGLLDRKWLSTGSRTILKNAPVPLSAPAGVEMKEKTADSYNLSVERLKIFSDSKRQ